MNFSLLAGKFASLVRPRASPISLTAVVLTFGLMAVGLVSSAATHFVLASLPNVMPLLIGIVALDVLSQFALQTKKIEAVQALIYGVLFLATICLSGVLAAYSLQRFAFPLRDDFLNSADLALGLNWDAFAHWVGAHAAVQTVFYWAYHSLPVQIALPLLIFSFCNRVDELRTYLLAFAIAFTVTIFISALLPAVGPVVFADRAAFGHLQFSGATPVDHLMRLREAGPLILRESPGGIATFPSFHATVGVLTPLILRKYPRTFAGLLVLDALMLAATVTEGAHYFTDVFAGTAMAFFAYAVAQRVVRIEDRAVRRPADPPRPTYSPEELSVYFSRKRALSG